MVESLWNTADEYLAATLLTTMGIGSVYTTLQIASVQVWAQFDGTDLAAIPRPFAIVNSWDTTIAVSGQDGEPGPDGVKRIKRDNTYLYTIVTVCDGTQASATRDAKTLVWRQEHMLAGLRFADVTALDGSKIGRSIRVKDSHFMRSNIALWPRATSGNDNMYGLAITAFALGGTV